MDRTSRARSPLLNPAIIGRGRFGTVPFTLTLVPDCSYGIRDCLYGMRDCLYGIRDCLYGIRAGLWRHFIGIPFDLIFNFITETLTYANIMSKID